MNQKILNKHDRSALYYSEADVASGDRALIEPTEGKGIVFDPDKYRRIYAMIIDNRGNLLTNTTMK